MSFAKAAPSSVSRMAFIDRLEAMGEIQINFVERVVQSLDALEPRLESFLPMFNLPLRLENHNGVEEVTLAEFMWQNFKTALSIPNQHDEEGENVLYPFIESKKHNRIVAETVLLFCRYNHEGSPSLVLVVQQRRPTAAFTIEPPGGIIDPGKTPREAGYTEVRQETGFEVVADGAAEGPEVLVPKAFATPGSSSEDMQCLLCDVRKKDGTAIADEPYLGIEGCFMAEGPTELEETERRNDLRFMVCSVKRLSGILRELNLKAGIETIVALSMFAALADRDRRPFECTAALEM